MSNPLNVKCPRMWTALCQGTFLRQCTDGVNGRVDYDTNGHPIGGIIEFVDVEFHSERVALAELVKA